MLWLLITGTVSHFLLKLCLLASNWEQKFKNWKYVCFSSNHIYIRQTHKFAFLSQIWNKSHWEPLMYPIIWARKMWYKDRLKLGGSVYLRVTWRTHPGKEKVPLTSTYLKSVYMISWTWLIHGIVLSEIFEKILRFKATLNMVITFEWGTWTALFK